jgi:hypothetical protein
VAWQRTASTVTRSAWARGVNRAWKKFWRTAPRKPVTKNKGRRRCYPRMQTHGHRHSQSYARAISARAGQVPSESGRAIADAVDSADTHQGRIQESAAETPQCRIRESAGMTCLASTRRALGRTTKSDPGYDSDSFLIAINNACSYCITNDKTHFIGNPEVVRIRVKGVGGEVTATLKGTVSWSFTNDQGEVHHERIPKHPLRCKCAILPVLTTACRPDQE